jgi:hypothetical protein
MRAKSSGRISTEVQVTPRCAAPQDSSALAMSASAPTGDIPLRYLSLRARSGLMHRNIIDEMLMLSLRVFLIFPEHTEGPPRGGLSKIRLGILIRK